MTDDRTPDPLDELASALLDDAAGPDDAARAAEPAVAARRAAFEEVRAAIRAEAPHPTAQGREAAIAAALAAADQADGSVVALDARRAGRSRWARAVGVAAAVVLAAALVPTLLDGGEGSDDQTASDQPARERTTALEDHAADEDAGGDASAAAPAPEAAGGTGGGGGTASALSTELTLVDLGVHPDLASLLDAVRRQVAAPSPDSPVAVPSPETSHCLDGAIHADQIQPGFIVLAAAAVLADRPVTVAVVDNEVPQPERRIVVLDPAAGCAELAVERR